MSRHVLFLAFDTQSAITRFRRAVAASPVSGSSFDTNLRHRSQVRPSRLMPWETDAASGLTRGVLLGGVLGGAFIALAQLAGVLSPNLLLPWTGVLSGILLGAGLGALGGGLGGLGTPAGALRRMRSETDAPWIMTISSDDDVTHDALVDLARVNATAWSERKLLGVGEPTFTPASKQEQHLTA